MGGKVRHSLGDVQLQILTAHNTDKTNIFVICYIFYNVCLQYLTYTYRTCIQRLILENVKQM